MDETAEGQTLRRLYWVLLAILLLFTGVAYYFVSLLFASLVLTVGFLFWWLYRDYSFERYQKRLQRQRTMHFVEAMAYVKIFLYGGASVYQAFLRAMDHVHPWVRTQLELTVQAIDQDKSYRPYFDLAQKFSDVAIEQLLIALFQMNQNGFNGLFVSNFFYIFDKLESSLSHARSEAFGETLDAMQSFPLLGTALITLTILASIVVLIQEMIGGL